MCLISVSALLLLGCGLLPDLRSLLVEAEELLPLASIGGIPIQVVAEVDFENRHLAAGAEIESSAGAWTHTQEGRLMSTIGWQPHLDRIEGAHGGGRYVCYYDWGNGSDPATPHWTVQWSGDLSFDEPGRGSARPLIHLATYGNDVLVLYAPPGGFTHWHPGSPDDCQNPDPVPAHEASADLYFPLDDVDVERAPDAETSTLTAVQEGIVLLRIPLDRLRSGTSETATVNLGGTDQGYYGTTEWSLAVSLTLTSKPGEP
jgi:hypothetical protein